MLVLLRISEWWGAPRRARSVLSEGLIARASGTVQYDLVVCHGWVEGTREGRGVYADAAADGYRRT